MCDAPSEKGTREYRQMPEHMPVVTTIETSFMISLSQKLRNWYNMSKNADVQKNIHRSPVHIQ